MEGRGRGRVGGFLGVGGVGVDNLSEDPGPHAVFFPGCEGLEWDPVLFWITSGIPSFEGPMEREKQWKGHEISLET